MGSIQVVVEEAPWKFLPEGLRDDAVLQKLIGNRKVSPPVRAHIEERLQCQQKMADSLGIPPPLRIIAGIGGWRDDYFGVVFPNVFVLECLWYGNAVYFVPRDKWEEYSGMTKQELRGCRIVEIGKTVLKSRFGKVCWQHQ